MEKGGRSRPTRAGYNTRSRCKAKQSSGKARTRIHKRVQHVCEEIKKKS